MDTSQTSGQKIDMSRLITELGSFDVERRKRARRLLNDAGKAAVPALMGAIFDPNVRIRWEAIKALGKIGDPSAAPGLVKALEDENVGNRWAASESLIALKQAAVVPLLEALTVRFDSVRLRIGAHHVLHVLRKDGQLSEPVEKVFKALEDVEPEVEVPWAAQQALNEFKHGTQAAKGAMDKRVL
jgi:HEAT repeat protein